MDLYVGNLHFDLNEIQVQKLFEAIGTVTRVTILRSKETGISKGKAFIVMPDAIQAQRAIDEFDGLTLLERQLIVSEARRGNEEPGEENIFRAHPSEEVERVVSKIRAKSDYTQHEPSLKLIDKADYSTSDDDGYVKIKFSN